MTANRRPSPSDRTKASKPLVRAIISEDHDVVMDPPIPLLEPLLEYRTVVHEQGGPLGYQPAEETRALYTFDHKGRLVFPAGLLPRMKGVLEQNGYRVEVEDWRKLDKAVVPDKEFLAAASEGDRPFLEAVAAEALGQTEVRSFSDAVAKAALICELYPKARVVFGVYAKAKAKRWRSALEKALDGPVGLAASGRATPRNRVMVSTFTYLKTCYREGKSILVLPDALEATGDLAVDRTAGITWSRVYALLPAGRRVGDRARLRLEGMAGPLVHRTVEPAASVRVLLAKVPRCRIRGEIAGLERKRAAVWYNVGRNRIITDVAKALMRGNVTVLRRHGIDVVAGDLPGGDSGPTVAILVESTEHGRELLDRLKGWSLLDAVPLETGEQGEQGIAPALKTMDKMVVTEARADVTEITVDVLVRATGGASSLRVRDFPPKGEEAAGRVVWLVDFLDNSDRESAAEARLRLHEYETRGWKMVPEQ